jgi:hypothetical protein
MGRADGSRDVIVAAGVGALVSGAPSTLHALATGRDPLEAARAAGSLLLPRERRPVVLVLAAGPVHGAVSLLWAGVLARTLPRRATVLAGAAAGLGIAALDLGLIGRRIGPIRRLPPWPQVADHVAFGASVGGVLAYRRRRGRAAGGPIAGGRRPQRRPFTGDASGDPARPSPGSSRALTRCAPHRARRSRAARVRPA